MFRQCKKENTQKSFTSILIALLAICLGFVPSLVLGLDVSVTANIEGWQNSGLTVTPKQTVTITATGEWCWGSGSNECTSPDGISSHGLPCPTPNCAPSPMLVDGAFIGELVGRVGNTVYRLGSSKTITPAESGPLMLGFNDWLGLYSDNSGSITTGALTSITPTPKPKTTNLLLTTVVTNITATRNPLPLLKIPPPISLVGYSCTVEEINGNLYKRICRRGNYFITRHYIKNTGICYREFRGLQTDDSPDSQTVGDFNEERLWPTQSPYVLEMQRTTHLYDRMETTYVKSGRTYNTQHTVRWYNNDHLQEDIWTWQTVNGSTYNHCDAYRQCSPNFSYHGCSHTEKPPSSCTLTEMYINQSLGQRPPSRKW